MAGFDLGDYVTVPERVQQFYAAHPDGRIVSSTPEVITVDGKVFIGVTTSVFRSPDDWVPCVASAWEPFPGRSSFVKDSEMMNAETSAIGRALAAAGIAVNKSMASRTEVMNRQADDRASGASKPSQGRPKAPEAPPVVSTGPKVSDDVVAELVERMGKLPADLRRDVKNEFMTRFGTPQTLDPKNLIDAYDLIARAEADVAAVG